MQHQLVLALSTVTLCASVAGAQEERRDDRVRVYAAPGTAVRTLSFGSSSRSAIGVSTSSGSARDTLGLLVSSVTADGPAERAGIEEGNRIQAINGVSLRATREEIEDWAGMDVQHRRLTRELDKVKPGDEVTLRILAGSQSREVRVRTVEPSELYRNRVSIAAGRRADEVRARVDSMRRTIEDRPTLGISLGNTGSMRDTLGVLVLGVTEGGPAEKAGIEEGSRIQAIDGIDLRASRDDVEDGLASVKARRLARALEGKKAGDAVELRIYSSGQTRTVRVTAMRAGDLPSRGGSRIFFGDGIAPRMPVLPRFNFDFDAPMHRRLDDLQFEFDGERIGRELERVGPILRDQLQQIGPEVRWNVDRAVRSALDGLDTGLVGLDVGLESVARALDGLDLRVNVRRPREP